MAGYCLDYSNRGKTQLPKLAYYMVAGIHDKDVTRFSSKDTMMFAMTSRHYGPWTKEEQSDAKIKFKRALKKKTKYTL